MTPVTQAECTIFIVYIGAATGVISVWLFDPVLDLFLNHFILLYVDPDQFVHLFLNLLHPLHLPHLLRLNRPLSTFYVLVLLRLRHIFQHLQQILLLIHHHPYLSSLS